MTTTDLNEQVEGAVEKRHARVKVWSNFALVTNERVGGRRLGNAYVDLSQKRAAIFDDSNRHWVWLRRSEVGSVDSALSQLLGFFLFFL